MSAYDAAMSTLILRVDELEKTVAQHQAVIDDVLAAVKSRIVEAAEETRKQRWLDTYNAALPEAIRLLGGINDDEERADRAHAMAAFHADRAHGPLVKP